MNVCLVKLPSPFLIAEKAFPPLGLLAVGTGLKERNHEVTIYDDSLENIPIDFEYYGFGPTTPEYPYALKAKDDIKEINPKARMVIGGAYATINPTKCLEDGFDCVLTGDGEIEAEEAFFSDKKVINAKEYPLDYYPILDRSLLDIHSYAFILNGIPATTIISERGCPFKCAFCCKNYTTVRKRSAAHVIKEIQQVHFEYGFNALVFPDDLFIIDRKRVEAIQKALQKWKIIWRCLVRADMIVKWGKEFVKNMAKSGCVEVGMGVESGSDKILKIVNKSESVETIKKAIIMLQDEGIRVKGFFIVGLPGETLDTIDETDRFLEQVQLDDVDIKVFQPMPGSPIWNNRDKYDLGWTNTKEENMWYKGRQGEYVGDVYTSHLTNAQIVEKQIYLENKYKRWS